MLLYKQTLDNISNDDYSYDIHLFIIVLQTMNKLKEYHNDIEHHFKSVFFIQPRV